MTMIDVRFNSMATWPTPPPPMPALNVDLHNLRSIALGLKALRAVDRYGVSRRGEQYAGFRAALTAGGNA